MQQNPTAQRDTGPDKVALALASIEAAKEENDSPDLSRCLEFVAGLIKASGDPDTVFDRVLEHLAREQLRALAKAHGLQLLASTEASVDDGTVTEVVLFWPKFAILPHGQAAKASLAQLSASIAQQLDEQRLGADFQASVAAGHTEDVETWYARVRAAG